MSYLFFLYGLAFVVCGIAVAARVAGRSGVELSRPLKWIATFSLVHGFSEWFILLQISSSDETISVFASRLAVMTASYSYIALVVAGLLLRFGNRIKIYPLLSLVGSAVFLGYYNFLAGFVSDPILSVAGRWLLGVPGALLTGWGLIALSNLHSKPSIESSGSIKDRRTYPEWGAWICGAFFILYAIATPFAQSAPFFPATFINAEAFIGLFGVQVEVVRMCLAVAILVSSLAMFGFFDRREQEMLHAEIANATRDMKIALINAEESERVRDAFFANMSHEIRTPLNSILGFSEVLLMRTKNEEDREILEHMKSGGLGLLSIINDVLDAAKLKSGKFEIYYEPVDLRGLIEKVASSFAADLKDCDVELVTSVASNIPHHIRIDPARLRQILTNLIGNSMKFTEQGSIEVSARVAANKGQGRSIEISVRDTGIGIPGDELEAIFEPFDQVDQSYARKHGGTGLGLSISKMLTELMDGEIGVDSELGRGSRFWILLPLRVTDDVAPQEKAIA